MTRVATEADLGVTDAQRFTLELEFVSCLANPRYVNCARAHTPLPR